MRANPTALVDGTEFRTLMSGFPTGVAIVTATDADLRPWGMTCSSVCSVSMSPPTLLVCLRDGSPTLRAVLPRSTFALNLLHGGARATAELFASGAPDRFDRVTWRDEPSSGGPHLPADAHTVADCRVSYHRLVGDHVVVFGEVFRVTRQPSGSPVPLLYGLREYSRWQAM